MRESAPSDPNVDGDGSSAIAWQQRSSTFASASTSITSRPSATRAADGIPIRCARRRSPSRPAPMASPRICARIAATSATTTSRGSRRRSPSRSIWKWRRPTEMVAIALETATARGLSRARAARRAHDRRRPRRRRAAQSAGAGGGQAAGGRHPRLAVHRRRAAADPGGGARSARPVIEIHTGAWCDALADNGHRRRRRNGSASADGAQACARVSASKFMPATAWISRRRRRSPRCREIVELNIGHFLIGEAVFVGLAACA